MQTPSSLFPLPENFPAGEDLLNLSLNNDPQTALMHFLQANRKQCFLFLEAAYYTSFRNPEWFEKNRGLIKTIKKYFFNIQPSKRLLKNLFQTKRTDRIRSLCISVRKPQEMESLYQKKQDECCKAFFTILNKARQNRDFDILDRLKKFFHNETIQDLEYKTREEICTILGHSLEFERFAFDCAYRYDNPECCFFTLSLPEHQAIPDPKLSDEDQALLKKLSCISLDEIRDFNFNELLQLVVKCLNFSVPLQEIQGNEAQIEKLLGIFKTLIPMHAKRSDNTINQEKKLQLQALATLLKIKLKMSLSTQSFWDQYARETLQGFETFLKRMLLQSDFRQICILCKWIPPLQELFLEGDAISKNALSNFEAHKPMILMFFKNIEKFASLDIWKACYDHFRKDKSIRELQNLELESEVAREFFLNMLAVCDPDDLPRLFEFLPTGSLSYWLEDDQESLAEQARALVNFYPDLIGWSFIESKPFLDFMNETLQIQNNQTRSPSIHDSEKEKENEKQSIPFKLTYRAKGIFYNLPVDTDKISKRLKHIIKKLKDDLSEKDKDEAFDNLTAILAFLCEYPILLSQVRDENNFLVDSEETHNLQKLLGNRDDLQGILGQLLKKPTKKDLTTRFLERKYNEFLSIQLALERNPDRKKKIFKFKQQDCKIIFEAIRKFAKEQNNTEIDAMLESFYDTSSTDTKNFKNLVVNKKFEKFTKRLSLEIEKDFYFVAFCFDPIQETPPPKNWEEFLKIDSVEDLKLFDQQDLNDIIHYLISFETPTRAFDSNRQLVYLLIQYCHFISPIYEHLLKARLNYTIIIKNPKQDLYNLQKQFSREIKFLFEVLQKKQSNIYETLSSLIPPFKKIITPYSPDLKNWSHQSVAACIPYLPLIGAYLKEVRAAAENQVATKKSEAPQKTWEALEKEFSDLKEKQNKESNQELVEFLSNILLSLPPSETVIRSFLPKNFEIVIPFLLDEPLNTQALYLLSEYSEFLGFSLSQNKAFLDYKKRQIAQQEAQFDLKHSSAVDDLTADFTIINPQSTETNIIAIIKDYNVFIATLSPPQLAVEIRNLAGYYSQINIKKFETLYDWLKQNPEIFKEVKNRLNLLNDPKTQIGLLFLGLDIAVSELI